MARARGRGPARATGSAAAAASRCARSLSEQRARRHAPGVPRVVVRGRRIRALGGQAPADRGRMGEGRRLGPGCRRQPATALGREPANEQVANLDQLAFGCAPSGRVCRAAERLRGAADDGRRVGVDRERIRRLPRLSRVPLPRVLGGVLRRPYRVLRGGSWATQPDAVSNTFRNWDYPERRQIFAGFRCAADVEAGVTRGHREHGPEPVRIDVHLREGALASFADDVRSGLGSDPKAIPPKYFYDARGSELFEQITDAAGVLPDARRAVDAGRSGSRDHRAGATVRRWSSWARVRRARRTRCCGPMVEGGCGWRYVPVDVSEAAVEQCAQRLAGGIRGSRDPRRRGRLRAPSRPHPASCGPPADRVPRRHDRQPRRARAAASAARRCGGSSAPRTGCWSAPTWSRTARGWRPRTTTQRA